jgi:hypothetical protein
MKMTSKTLKSCRMTDLNGSFGTDFDAKSDAKRSLLIQFSVSIVPRGVSVCQ